MVDAAPTERGWNVKGSHEGQVLRLLVRIGHWKEHTTTRRLCDVL